MRAKMSRMNTNRWRIRKVKKKLKKSINSKFLKLPRLIRSKLKKFPKLTRQI